MLVLTYPVKHSIEGFSGLGSIHRLNKPLAHHHQLPLGMSILLWTYFDLRVTSELLHINYTFQKSCFLLFTLSTSTMICRNSHHLKFDFVPNEVKLNTAHPQNSNESDIPTDKRTVIEIQVLIG